MFKRKTGLEENWIFLENPIYQTKVAEEVLRKLKLGKSKRRIDLRFNDSHNTGISISLRKFLELKKTYGNLKEIKKFYKNKYHL